MSLRQLKTHLLNLLPAQDFSKSLEAIGNLPARQVINPLFGLLYHGDTLIRWRTVSAMGYVISRLADQDSEGARVIMRRLMWNLNDESGGIGWGSPEVMGDTVARHAGLAREYAAILISYLNPDGNFLEHEGLQAGLLWGLGRAARERPRLMNEALPFIVPFLASPNHTLCGLAIWCGLPLADQLFMARLQAFAGDRTSLTVYCEPWIYTCPVAELASGASPPCLPGR
jgi:hypothetical protein